MRIDFVLNFVVHGLILTHFLPIIKPFSEKPTNKHLWRKIYPENIQILISHPHTNTLDSQLLNLSLAPVKILNITGRSILRIERNPHSNLGFVEFERSFHVPTLAGWVGEIKGLLFDVVHPTLGRSLPLSACIGTILHTILARRNFGKERSLLSDLGRSTYPRIEEDKRLSNVKLAEAHIWRLVHVPTLAGWVEDLKSLLLVHVCGENYEGLCYFKAFPL